MSEADMSPKAISSRLRRAAQLRALCLRLARAGSAATAGRARVAERRASYPEGGAREVGLRGVEVSP